MYGQKRDFNNYLATRPSAPVHSLADVIAFNAVTPGATKYGQAIFEPRSNSTSRRVAPTRRVTWPTSRPFARFLAAG